MNLEQTLLQAARESGLSLAEIGRRAELPYASVHGFVVDEKNITLKTASSLAEVLGLELRPVSRKRKR